MGGKTQSLCKMSPLARRAVLTRQDILPAPANTRQGSCGIPAGRRQPELPEQINCEAGFRHSPRSPSDLSGR
jgi:hypothetical protein